MPPPQPPHQYSNAHHQDYQSAHQHVQERFTGMDNHGSPVSVFERRNRTLPELMNEPVLPPSVQDAASRSGGFQFNPDAQPFTPKSEKRSEPRPPINKSLSKDCIPKPYSPFSGTWRIINGKVMTMPPFPKTLINIEEVEEIAYNAWNDYEKIKKQREAEKLKEQAKLQEQLDQQDLEQLRIQLRQHKKVLNRV